jgi:DNA primase
MTDKDTLRSDRAALVEVLENAGAKFRGNACTCCFHEDHHPSAGVYQKDGVWRFKCQVCGAAGDFFDIQAMIEGTSAADELRKTTQPKQPNRKPPAQRAFANLDAARAYLTANVGQIESEHPYTTIDGDMVQVVFRCKTTDGKTFRPVHLTDAGYVLGAAPKPWPLYRLREIAGAEMVVVCEGEKCADILARYGFAATTSAAGAKNAKNTNWTPLKGKHVVLWPDNDSDGRRYIADVQRILQGL